jgi:hypothetical protein
MPVVRGVIILRTASGSRFCVTGSISAKMGVISCHCSACAVATNVYEGTMTSPRNSKARVAISSAIVPLHIATQCLTPSFAMILFSNSTSIGPLLESQRLSRMIAGAGQEALVAADVGPADMDRLGEQRRRAVDGESRLP